MNKKIILNGIGGIWLLVNLPIVPIAYVPTLFFELFLKNIFDSQFSNIILYIIITFIVFIVVTYLSKLWLNKFLTVPVILSLIIFLLSLLGIAGVYDSLAINASNILWIIGFVFIGLLCAVIIQEVMRGNIKFRIK